jgi:DNA-binding PadR family transcriptional regulator
MKRVYLGEFEEIVMLTVAVLYGQAYGATVTQEIERQTGRSVTFSTVHTTLQRLEEKGFLSSGLGGATAERGGRRKRFYAVTAAGSQALQEIQHVRTQLWSQVHPQAMRMGGVV